MLVIRLLRYAHAGRRRQRRSIRKTSPAISMADPTNFSTHVDRSALDNRQVDLLLVVPANFQDILRKDGRPLLYVLTREGDERSRLVDNRVSAILRQWKLHLKDVRLLRQGLPADYDEPIEVRDAARSRPAGKRASDDLLEMLVRIFPFILVMWSLAGALYPAVDLCAGEKERGTMETLLISPASREEIVWGKFLTIWVFSAATALLNLLSMGITTWQFSRLLVADASFRPAALFWAVALLLPLSAFFSAICLAVGAYARSSKEGQYYLMPLFLLTMPLIFLTLAPGVELNHFYSMVPVTGVALLLQKLMAVKPPDNDLWGYFVPVLAPMVVYSWLALRWAIEQFQREEVLFREAERLDMKLWLRRLFREKEALPSAGQALFCFALIFGLHWLTLGVGGKTSLVSFSAIRYLAFVATPPLFMVLLLTTRPLQGLALRRPPWWAWPVAVVLAVLLLPPFVALTLFVLEQFPQIKQTLLSSQGTGNRDQGTGNLLLAASVRGRAARGVRGVGLSRLHAQRPAPALSTVDRHSAQQFPVCAVSDERLPVRAALPGRRRAGLLVTRTGSVVERDRLSSRLERAADCPCLPAGPARCHQFRAVRSPFVCRVSCWVVWSWPRRCWRPWHLRGDRPASAGWCDASPAG